MKRFQKIYIYYLSSIIFLIYVIFFNCTLKPINNKEKIILKDKQILFSDAKYLYLFNNNKIGKVFAKNITIYKWASDGKSFMFYNAKKHKIFIYDVGLKKIIYKKMLKSFNIDEVMDFEFIYNDKIFLFSKGYDKKYKYSLLSIDIKTNKVETLCCLENDSATLNVKNMYLDFYSRYLLFYFGDNYKFNNIFIFDIFEKKLIYKLNRGVPLCWLEDEKSFLYYYDDDRKNIYIKRYDLYEKKDYQFKDYKFNFKFKNIYIIKMSHQKDTLYFITKEKALSRFYCLDLKQYSIDEIFTGNIYKNKISLDIY